MNKKALFRILEAFIAVMIILGVVLVMVSRQRIESSKNEEIISLQKQIIDYVKVDEKTRSEILSNNSLSVNLVITKTIPSWLNYSVNICDASVICPNPVSNIKGQVYADEILITANKTYYPGNATRLVIFMWEK
jgi:hypothetical protein